MPPPCRNPFEASLPGMDPNLDGRMTADSIGSMRIALVSPYSWTFPGGVTRHIESLARELLEAGHHVRVLTPVDPDDRITRAFHRRRPSSDPLPDFVFPLGRTVALPMNGAVSRLSLKGEGVVRMRRELRTGDYDVIHVHARIAVSEAARWTGERYFGGTYEVIPNGVDLAAAPTGPKPPGTELRILFVGREEERKGLPVLLSAFAGLRRHIPTRLDVIGAGPEGVEPLLAEVEGGMESVEAHGHVSDEELWQRLHGADILCAPSLGGESFGMVLTEAFAAGTPVVASDIASYRQVVTHGVNGVLVPHGRPLELAEALRSLWLDPGRRHEMAWNARRRAGEFPWPNVAP